jgi:xanthine dehydrogenase YagS FAD-binding subunit
VLQLWLCRRELLRYRRRAFGAERQGKDFRTRGGRAVAIDNFFGPLGNVLEADEIVTEIQVPPPWSQAKQTFLKFRLRKAVDFPIVSVASIITTRSGFCRDARIALGAVAPRPIRATQSEQAIKGKTINAETAAEAAAIDALPLIKNAYKIKITKTLVKRAILASGSGSNCALAEL